MPFSDVLIQLILHACHGYPAFWQNRLYLCLNSETAVLSFFLIFSEVILSKSSRPEVFCKKGSKVQYMKFFLIQQRHRQIIQHINFFFKQIFVFRKPGAKKIKRLSEKFLNDIVL